MVWFDFILEGAQKILDSGIEPQPTLFIKHSREMTVVPLHILHKDDWSNFITKVVNLAKSSGVDIDGIAMVVSGFAKKSRPENYTGKLIDDPQSVHTVSVIVVQRNGYRISYVCTYETEGPRSMEPTEKVVSFGPWEESKYFESRFINLNIFKGD